MEFDSARAGGFEPLRFVPKGKKVVLGLVSSKTGTLEAKDELKHHRRGRQVRPARAPLPFAAVRIFLDPRGNRLTYDEQWRSWALIVEVAEEVWG